MRGQGGRSNGRRGSGRASSNRTHSRPATAPTPAAASAARVSAALERLLAQRGVSVTLVAKALGVRGLDVARWRRGQPVPSYRREDMEDRISRLEIVDEEGERRLEVRPKGPSLP